MYLDGSGEATQTQMSQQLETTNQRFNTICKELESMDIVQVKRKEGRNIFWALNPNPKFQIKGQISIKYI